MRDASIPLRGCAVRVVAGAVLLLATQGAPVRAEAPPPPGEPREDCIATYCQQDAIYQFGPAAGFAASLYEGPTYFSEVLRLGDFGLGATSPLDGEVIILDGTPYRAAVTGELEILSPTTRTPLVFVKHFRADRTVELPAVASLDDLVRTLDEEIGSKNLFWAARIDGRFARVELRSVPRQERPYKPLADVHLLRVTVVAPTTMQAEAAAKTAFILGQEKGLHWIEAQPEFAGLLVLETGDVIHSRRMQKYL